ncbi:MAG: hypothetical protein KGN84_13050 [Acidobacteriota bacterium]|nr:hypothetical protein [Acidobacteriota bacterium]
MVLRGQTGSLGRIIGLVFLAAAAISPAWGQNRSYEVRHRHIHGGSAGTLTFTQSGISFTEHTKRKRKVESWKWSYDEIEQLTIGAAAIHVLTYEDSAWKLGRDREYAFDRLPPNLASDVVPMLAQKLDQRFIAAVAGKQPAEWKIDAKLDRGLRGAIGILSETASGLVFETRKPDESRSWRMADIENTTTTGPFDLIVTTYEKTGAFRGSTRQFHFQLQKPLADDRYQSLWRRVNRSKGLTFLESQRSSQ